MQTKAISLFFLFLPGLTLAQSTEMPGNTSNGSFIWILIQAIFALLLMIGGIFLVVWVLKQFMNRTQRTGSGDNSNFQVVKQIPVSPKQQIYAVRFLDDLLLLGSSENGLTKIDCYRDFDRWDLFEGNATPLQDNFKSIFKGKLAAKLPGSGSGMRQN